ncbi:hypothetical protein PENSPDRAFT_669250 [Peniophora sp. CONT]|nr:hypothetical protein PENSPDRAFT_669250 [Peniophora sp. CONT]
MSRTLSDVCAATRDCIATSDKDRARTLKCNGCGRIWHLGCRWDGLEIHKKCVDDSTFSANWYCAKSKCHLVKKNRLASEQAVYVADSDDEVENPEEPVYVADSDDDIPAMSAKPASQLTGSGSSASSTIPVNGLSIRASSAPFKDPNTSTSKPPITSAPQQPVKRARVDDDDDSVRKRAKACVSNASPSSPAPSPTKSTHRNQHTGTSRPQSTQHDEEDSDSDGEFGAWARPPYPGTASRSCSPGGALTLSEYIEGTRVSLGSVSETGSVLENARGLVKDYAPVSCPCFRDSREVAAHDALDILSLALHFVTVQALIASIYERLVSITSIPIKSSLIRLVVRFAKGLNATTSKMTLTANALPPGLDDPPAFLSPQTSSHHEPRDGDTQPPPPLLVISNGSGCMMEESQPSPKDCVMERKMRWWTRLIRQGHVEYPEAFLTAKTAAPGLGRHNPARILCLSTPKKSSVADVNEMVQTEVGDAGTSMTEETAGVGTLTRKRLSLGMALVGGFRKSVQLDSLTVKSAMFLEGMDAKVCIHKLLLSQDGAQMCNVVIPGQVMKICLKSDGAELALGTRFMVDITRGTTPVFAIIAVHPSSSAAQLKSVAQYHGHASKTAFQRRHTWRSRVDEQSPRNGSVVPDLQLSLASIKMRARISLGTRSSVKEVTKSPAIVGCRRSWLTMVVKDRSARKLLRLFSIGNVRDTNSASSNDYAMHYKAMCCKDDSRLSWLNIRKPPQRELQEQGQQSQDRFDQRALHSHTLRDGLARCKSHLAHKAPYVHDAAVMDCSAPNPATLPAELWSIVFTFLALVWPAGGKRIISEGEEIGVTSLGWIEATHVCQTWRTVILGHARLWADAMCAFPDMDVIYEFKARSRKSPTTLDVDLLLSGCTTRDISCVIDRIWGDWEFFEGARSIHCTLGLDNSARMHTNYSSNGTLGTDAWMRLFLHQSYFPALTALTFPWTYQTLDLPDITANNLTYLRIVGVQVIADKAPCGYRPQTRSAEDVGDLADLIRFLQPLVQLNTLIIDRGSFAVTPEEQAVPTSFPTLLDMRITTFNLPLIQQMKNHILTPLDWDVATSVGPGEDLPPIIQLLVGQYDFASIDHTPAWTFITFSSFSAADDSSVPLSLLDAKFVDSAKYGVKINVHITRDHITFASRAMVPPHFHRFASTCRRIIFNHLAGPVSKKDHKRPVRKQWDYLSSLSTLEHVWLSNDHAMVYILSKLPPPKRLTVTCMEGSDATDVMNDIAPARQQWTESDKATPTITVTGTPRTDFTSPRHIGVGALE